MRKRNAPAANIVRESRQSTFVSAKISYTASDLSHRSLRGVWEYYWISGKYSSITLGNNRNAGAGTLKRSNL
jgi:hypothetical protein